MIQAMSAALFDALILQPVTERDGGTWWRLWAWNDIDQLTVRFGAYLACELASASPAAWPIGGKTYYLVVVGLF